MASVDEYLGFPSAASKTVPRTSFAPRSVGDNEVRAVSFARHDVLRCGRWLGPWPKELVASFWHLSTLPGSGHREEAWKAMTCNAAIVEARRPLAVALLVATQVFPEASELRCRVNLCEGSIRQLQT